MKKILCFGDSNTFGFNPENGKRFDEQTRWAGKLKIALKNKFEVIEKGANNRCGFTENKESTELSGLIAIKKYLELKPDIIILAVGINDLQKIYDNDEKAIYTGLKALVEEIKKENNPNIILLVPSTIKENILNSFFNTLFDEKSIEKSKKLPEIYQKIAKVFELDLIDLNNIAETSSTDGLHYDVKGHKKIADKLIEFIKTKFD